MGEEVEQLKNTLDHIVFYYYYTWSLEIIKMNDESREGKKRESSKKA